MGPGSSKRDALRADGVPREEKVTGENSKRKKRAVKQPKREYNYYPSGQKNKGSASKKGLIRKKGVIGGRNLRWLN